MQGPDFPGRLYYFSTPDGHEETSLNRLSAGQPAQQVITGIRSKPFSAMSALLSPSGGQVAYFSEIAAGRYQLLVRSGVQVNVPGAVSPEALVVEAAYPASLSWESSSGDGGQERDAGLMLSIPVNKGPSPVGTELYRIADWRAPKLEQLTSFNRNDRLRFILSEPDWQPGGPPAMTDRLAFSVYLAQNSDIFVMDLPPAEAGQSQGVPVNVTRHPANDTNPLWSPDGQKILFQSNREHGKTSLFIMNADGSGLRNLLASAGTGIELHGQAAWAPDGRSIVFTGAFSINPSYDELFLLELAQPRIRNLTRNTSSFGDIESPVWSPDGSWIAFLHERDLYLIRPDGTQLANLTRTPEIDEWDPKWLP